MASRSSNSIFVPMRAIRKWVLTAALAGALGLVACGGDDEEPSATTTESTPAPTAESTGTTETEAETGPDRTEETETLPDDGDGTGSPETQTGGAGDEEPARTLALLTGINGSLQPPVVRVPAFISSRVELRSGAGRPYRVRCRRRTLRVGDELSAAGTSFAGLRPGETLVGRGTGGTVVIEATAEPGP